MFKFYSGFYTFVSNGIANKRCRKHIRSNCCRKLIYYKVSFLAKS